MFQEDGVRRARLQAHASSPSRSALRLVGQGDEEREKGASPAEDDRRGVTAGSGPVSCGPVPPHVSLSGGRCYGAALWAGPWETPRASLFIGGGAGRFFHATSFKQNRLGKTPEQCATCLFNQPVSRFPAGALDRGDAFVTLHSNKASGHWADP